ncbi:MAG: ATP-binding protein [Thermoflexibacter sp.]|jgi:outer membrane protein assembly factor BamB|nr:ATP-binding protein [Thermoflexibacter sp.]
MKNQTIYLFVAVVALLVACGSENQESKDTSNDSTVVAVDTTQPKPVAELVKLWETDTTLTTCESVLYNPTANILYVANIVGIPTEKDKKGFISKLTLDGKIETLEWVTGLNAPKGMGVIGNKLFVTDITEIVEIDIEKGKISKKYPVKGSEFLNDITTDATTGTVYFTDMKKNKIHTLDSKTGKIAELIGADSLGSPNGLFFVDASTLMLATNGDSKFKKIDLTTKQVSIVTEGIDAGDGVEKVGDNAFLVSSWTGEVFYINQGEKLKLLDTQDDKINSADIGYVPSSKTLLVPTFFKNKVVAYQLVVNE